MKCLFRPLMNSSVEGKVGFSLNFAAMARAGSGLDKDERCVDEVVMEE